MHAAAKSEFAGWYPQEYLKSWNTFLTLFPRGVERLKGRDEWQQTAAKMAGDDGPYWAVLSRAASELEPMAFDKDLPPWVKLVLQMQLIKVQIAAEAGTQDKGLLTKAAETGKKLIGDLEKMLSKVPGLSFEAQAKAVPVYREFQKSLDNITPVSASRKLAFEMTGQVYGQDEVTGQAPFFPRPKPKRPLGITLTTGNQNEEPFWKLIDGPLGIFVDLHAQRDWLSPATAMGRRGPF